MNVIKFSMKSMKITVIIICNNVKYVKKLLLNMDIKNINLKFVILIKFKLMITYRKYYKKLRIQ